jgi:hypothetical protein
MRLIAFGALIAVLITAGCGSQTARPGPELPNPYITALGTGEVFFNDLAATCTIEIFTLAGETVRTISVVNGNGQVSWDLKNNNGEPLLSGTYDYLITNTSVQKSGKIVIIK